MTTKPEKLLPLLSLTVLVIDQGTKYIALATLTTGQSVPFIGDLIRWTLVFNPGGAFSLRLGDSNYYLILSILIFLVLVIYIYRHRRTRHLAVPLSLVAGGAAGNIIDRFRFGRVVDFIDCEFIDFSVGSYKMDRWPIFNVADMAVSCGIIVTIFLVYFNSRRMRRKEEPAERPGQSAADSQSNESNM